MKEQEKRTLLNKISDWLGLSTVSRRIKDVEEWSGAASNYSSTEEYCNACLINVNSGDPEEWTQANCKLPIREEGDSSDTFVRQAVFAAAGGNGISAVTKPEDVSAEDWGQAVRDAANELVRAYNEMDEDAPDSVVELAERSKERALSSGQIWSMIYEHLDRVYGWDYWPMDIYYDATGMPFCIVVSGGKLFRYSIMIDGDMATLGEAIPVVQEFVPTVRTTTTIRRQQDNTYRWFSVSASSVLNRVGEIDSRELFDSFVAHAEKTGEYPIRQFYHAGESFRTGQADFLARDENLYITSGVYDDTEIAQREVKARQAEPDYWGDSIGYKPTAMPELLEIAKDVTIPVYKRGINKEISTLPEQQAANLFTANTEVLQVRRAMALNEKQKEAFVKLFDGNEEEADQWLDEHAEARNRAIEDNGLITRSDEEGESDNNTQEPVVHEVDLGQEDLAEITRMTVESEPIQNLIGSVQELTTAIEGERTEAQQRQKQLTTTLKEITDRLEALEADDEAKQREWLQAQPRRFSNGVKHIIRPRVARAAEGEEGEPETFAEKANQTIANKGIPTY